MKIVFSVERSNYVNCPELGFTITEHNWNLNVLPKIGDIIDLFPFIEEGNENISPTIPGECQIQDVFLAIRSEAASIQYTVSGRAWSKDGEEPFCQIDLVTP